jgi:hypothetical protein
LQVFHRKGRKEKKVEKGFGIQTVEQKLDFSICFGYSQAVCASLSLLCALCVFAVKVCILCGE